VKNLILRAVVYCSVLAVVASARPSRVWAQSGTDTQRPLSSNDWREDLHYLAQQMPLKHKQLFHTMTEAAFTDAVQKLDADIPQLNDDQIFVRLA
jgi:hypothetical protein